MISKDNNMIRFAVGTPNTPLSLAWRLWTLNDNIYIGAKNGDDCFKISLYEDKEWRIAYVKALNQNDSYADDVIYNWNKPTSPTPEFIHCISIIVPSTNKAESPKRNKAEDKRLVWTKEAEAGKCVIFKIYLSWPRMKKFDLNIIMKEGDVLIGNIEKQNGEKVWLIEREDFLSNEYLDNIKTLETKGLKDKSSLLNVVTEGNMALLGQPTIFDIGAVK